MLRKAVEHRLEREIPLEYRSRYSMVMYSHIPYAVARSIGERQRKLLDDLCAGLESAEQLDIERARAAVRRCLAPLLQQHGVKLDY